MQPHERYGFPGGGQLSAPVDPEGEADLFHVTRPVDAKRIFREGLLKDSASPAEKIADENTPDDATPGGVMEDPKDVKADWQFDETIADARRGVEGTGRFPSHRDAVFAWPRIKNAKKAAIGMKGSPRAIVHIDSSKMPGCTFAAAPSRPLSEIWEGIWNRYNDFASESERLRREAAYEAAQEWWETVEMYDPETDYRRRHEVWTGCNVPPEAIVKITDPDRDIGSDRPILQPPREGEQTLRDFAAAKQQPVQDIIDAAMGDGGRNPKGSTAEDGFRAPGDRSTVYRVGKIVVTEAWLFSFSINRSSGGLGTGLYAYATPEGAEASKAGNVAGTAGDPVYELPGILQNPLVLGKKLNGRDRENTHNVHDFAGLLSLIADRERDSPGYIDNFPDDFEDTISLDHNRADWVREPTGIRNDNEDPVTETYGTFHSMSLTLGSDGPGGAYTTQPLYEAALDACRTAAQQEGKMHRAELLQPINYLLYPEYDGIYPVPAAGGNSNKWGVCVFKQRLDELLGRDVEAEEPIDPAVLKRALGEQ